MFRYSLEPLVDGTSTSRYIMKPGPSQIFLYLPYHSIIKTNLPYDIDLQHQLYLYHHLLRIIYHPTS